METIKPNELRIGNYVQMPLGEIVQVDIIGSHEYPNFIHAKNEKGDSGQNAFEPIPLNEEWLLKLPKGLIFPDWIKHVHTLQNWYLYENKCEKELTLNQKP